MRRNDELSPASDYSCQCEEVVARVSELSTAYAVYDLTVAQRPGKLVMLCQKARVLKRSDRTA